MKKYKLIKYFGLNLPILFPKYNILHFKICCSNRQKFKYFVSHAPIWIVNIPVLYFFVECPKSLLLENIFVGVTFTAVLANFTVETTSNNFIFYFLKNFFCMLPVCEVIYYCIFFRIVIRSQFGANIS